MPAYANGFDVKALRTVVRLRKQDVDRRFPGLLDRSLSGSLYELLECAFAADPGKAYGSMHRAQRARAKPGVCDRDAAGPFHFGKRAVDSYA